MMTSSCENLIYSPAESALTQGHRCGEKPHRSKNGRFVNPTGAGWAVETKPAEVTVVFTVENGSRGAYRLDWLVRQIWGKVTERKARLLCSTMPTNLSVTECDGNFGAKYYIPVENELIVWITNAIMLGGGR